MDELLGRVPGPCIKQDWMTLLRGKLNLALSHTAPTPLPLAKNPAQAGKRQWAAGRGGSRRNPIDFYIMLSALTFSVYPIEECRYKTEQGFPIAPPGVSLH